MRSDVSFQRRPWLSLLVYVWSYPPSQRSNAKSYVTSDFSEPWSLNQFKRLCTSQIEASTPPEQPPGQPPRHFNFWRLACSNSLPSGQKSRSNASPISAELPLLKGKFRLKSNIVHAFQWENCRYDTFKLLFKTLLKELFANKGEILSSKSVKPCKNRKNSGAYYTSTRDKFGSNSPPFQVNVKFLPPRARCTVKCPGYARGGMLKFQFDRYITCVMFVWKRFIKCPGKPNFAPKKLWIPGTSHWKHTKCKKLKF